MILVSRILTSFTFVVLFGFAQLGAQDEVGKVVRVENDDETNLRESLNKKTNFDFQDTLFSEIVMQIQHDFDIPIIVDESAEDNGLTEDRSISLVVSDIPLRSGFQIILDDYDCSFVIEHAVMKIVSTEVAKRKTISAIYDVSDINADSEALIATIFECILRDSWIDNGGFGEISPIVANERQLLVVSHTEDGHYQVRRFLDSIRKAVDSNIGVSRTADKTNLYLVESKASASPKEVVDLIHDALPEIVWDDEKKYFIKSYGSLVIVRQSDLNAKKIEKFLAKAGIYNESSGGIGGEVRVSQTAN